jgi:pimeloyl-ACP methyl ester carboxylesterase
MTQGYVDTNGVRLWYEALGPANGKPVLLIMGVDASVVWWPSEFIDVLVNAGCRVVRFDNRDIGLSTHIDFAAKPYRVEDMVSDTLGLMESLSIKSANLVGMSLGGIICQQFALQQPLCVRSLTLISATPGPDDRLPKPNKKVFSSMSAPPENEEEWVDSVVAFCRALAGSRFAFDEDQIRELARADVARGTNIRSNHARLPQLSSRVDRLREIHAPTLVVHGTDDPLFPLEHAKALAQGIPGARLVEWDRVGHEIPVQLAQELGQRVVEVVR